MNHGESDRDFQDLLILSGDSLRTQEQQQQQQRYSSFGSYLSHLGETCNTSLLHTPAREAPRQHVQHNNSYPDQVQPHHPGQGNLGFTRVIAADKYTNTAGETSSGTSSVNSNWGRWSSFAQQCASLPAAASGAAPAPGLLSASLRAKRPPRDGSCGAEPAPSSATFRVNLRTGDGDGPQTPSKSSSQSHKRWSGGSQPSLTQTCSPSQQRSPGRRSITEPESPFTFFWGRARAAAESGSGSGGDDSNGANFTDFILNDEQADDGDGGTVFRPRPQQQKHQHQQQQQQQRTNHGSTTQPADHQNSVEGESVNPNSQTGSAVPTVSTRSQWNAETIRSRCSPFGFDAGIYQRREKHSEEGEADADPARSHVPTPGGLPTARRGSSSFMQKLQEIAVKVQNAEELRRCPEPAPSFTGKSSNPYRKWGGKGSKSKGAANKKGDGAPASSNGDSALDVDSQQPNNTAGAASQNGTSGGRKRPSAPQHKGVGAEAEGEGNTKRQKTEGARTRAKGKSGGGSGGGAAAKSLPAGLGAAAGASTGAKRTLFSLQNIVNCTTGGGGGGGRTNLTDASGNRAGTDAGAQTANGHSKNAHDASNASGSASRIPYQIIRDTTALLSEIKAALDDPERIQAPSLFVGFLTTTSLSGCGTTSVGAATPTTTSNSCSAASHRPPLSNFTLSSLSKGKGYVVSDVFEGEAASGTERLTQSHSDSVTDRSGDGEAALTSADAAGDVTATASPTKMAEQEGRRSKLCDDATGGKSDTHAAASGSLHTPRQAHRDWGYVCVRWRDKMYVIPAQPTGLAFLCTILNTQTANASSSSSSTPASARETLSLHGGCSVPYTINGSGSSNPYSGVEVITYNAPALLLPLWTATGGHFSTHSVTDVRLMAWMMQESSHLYRGGGSGAGSGELGGGGGTGISPDILSDYPLLFHRIFEMSSANSSISGLNLKKAPVGNNGGNSNAGTASGADTATVTTGLLSSNSFAAAPKYYALFYNSVEPDANNNKLGTAYPSSSSFPTSTPLGQSANTLEMQALQQLVNYVFTLAPLYRLLYSALGSRGLLQAFLRQEKRISPLIAQMKANGVWVDFSRVEKFRAHCTEVMRETRDKAHAYVRHAMGDDFNIQSTDQVRYALYTVLDLGKHLHAGGGGDVRSTGGAGRNALADAGADDDDTELAGGGGGGPAAAVGPMHGVSTTRGGKLSTAEETLKALSAHHEFPALVIRYRKAAKLLQTYVEGMMAYAYVIPPSAIAAEEENSATSEKRLQATGAGSATGVNSDNNNSNSNNSNDFTSVNGSALVTDGAQGRASGGSTENEEEAAPNERSAEALFDDQALLEVSPQRTNFRVRSRDAADGHKKSHGNSTDNANHHHDDDAVPSQYDSSCPPSLSTDALPTSGYGRIHASFLQEGTDTGRLSCVEPNLQSLPRSTWVYSKSSIAAAAALSVTVPPPPPPAADAANESGELAFRRCFVAPPGFLLVSVDYQQIELRVLAHLCGDETLIAALGGNSGGAGASTSFHHRSGNQSHSCYRGATGDGDSSSASSAAAASEDDGDIHRRIAELIFNKSPVTSEERTFAKRVVFGVLYGAGPQLLARQMGVSVARAQHISGQLRRAFPTLDRFQASVVQQARASGLVRTLSGRTRLLPGISSNSPGYSSSGSGSGGSAAASGDVSSSSNSGGGGSAGASTAAQRAYAERQAFNTLVQGSAADVMKLAMLAVEREVLRRWPGDCLLIMQIHDEMVLAVRRARVAQAVPAVSAAMTRATSLRVPLRVTAKVGPSLGDLREWTVDDDLGLTDF